MLLQPLKSLPAGINASPSYCQCSRAFIQSQWEDCLGRPLEVEVGETALTGAEECKFIIHL
jgi:predicted hydrocarbon binding protein